MDNCLVISDLHAAYHHPDTIPFLTALKKKYKIRIVKQTGDFADNHFGSYHEIEYGTYSAEEEYKRTKKFAQQLDKLFYDCDFTVSLGNHDIIGRRKAKTANIPEDYLMDFNMLYGVPWKFVDKDYFAIDRKQMCLMTHSLGSNTLTNARIHSHCSIQGHHHGLFGIEYFADTETIRWSMSAGCLINPRAPAFNYAKYNASKRPIIGCGGIIENNPELFPMKLSKSGRWTGKL